MKIFALRYWLLCLALAAPVAMAASTCPLIRPPGLSPQRVDDVVANAYAGWLHRPPQELDTSKTIQALDGTDNAILAYSFGTMNVGDALGFDAVKALYDAAEAKGAKQPVDSLSIAEIQAAARAIYAKGRDEPPPIADLHAEYAVVRLPIHVPLAPAGDWRLTHCGADDVTFVRPASGGVGAFAASLRDASMSKYVSDVRFLEQFHDNLAATLPLAFQEQPWQPTIVKGTPAPCADATLNVKEESGVGMYLRVRACYYKPDNPNTWFMMFSELLVPGQKADTVPAEAFIAATTPK